MPAAARRLLLALLALVCAAATLTPQAASAAAPPAPKNDSVSFFAGASKLVNVLGNDVDADGDKLAICRLGAVPDALTAFKTDDEFGEDLGEGAGSIFVHGTRPGTYSFTYYACDFQTLVPATVTVTIKPVLLRVRKVEDRPGRVRIINDGNFRMRFMWGKWDNEEPDGSVLVPAHSRVGISVRRPSIFYVAFSPRTGAIKFGNVRRIELPAGVKPLRPGAAPPEVMQELAQALRSTEPAVQRTSARWAPAL